MTRASKSLKNFVNGAQVEAADGRTTDVINPSTGEVYATAPLSGPADVDAAMAAAAAAFETSGGTPRRVSGAWPCYRIADAVEARAAELVKLGVREHRQADRADRERGDPADGRPDPLLRRRGPGARGPRARVST